ncbi:MAG: M20/M25/M40 family metallo-hydrolase [Elusimicrobia bacterium]|nr:M20/M25/M40 family metallo-hydrolase [Elusimicrobiota bacterium]
MVSRRLIDLFLELARIDGLPGKEAPVANHLLTYLKHLGLEPKADGTAAACLSNTSNIVCSVGGGGSLALVSQMDTFRRTSTIRPVVSADRITGEGGAPGADGRAGMAAILYAVERAIHSNQPLKPFTLVFTTRGAGNMAGARHAVLPQSVRSAFVFSSPLDPGTYTSSSPGIAVFSADVLGRASDAGIDPEHGVCAISIAARAISALSWGRHDPETTSNIGTIAGGAGTAIVPPAALARGQIRAQEEAKALPILERIKAEFESSAAAAGGAASFKWSWEYAPYSHPKGAEVCLAAEAASRAAGLAPSAVPSPGGSEANALNARGIPAVNLGIGVRNPRANGEHILLDHLSKASELAWQLIRKN